MFQKRSCQSIAVTILLLLVFSACGNKPHYTEPVVQEPVVDTVRVYQQVESPKVEEESSVPSGSSSTSTSQSPKYDNMRGFDPASEDDMDDNGMSRYMENNDEEGWD